MSQTNLADRCGRLTWIIVLASIGWIVFSACSGVSTPQDYHCQYDAEERIKARLQYPSTYDEHGLLTRQKMKDLATVDGNKEDGWTITTAIMFGAKNAFGVQSDYLAWYTAEVSAEGKCGQIMLDDFISYR